MESIKKRKKISEEPENGGLIMLTLLSAIVALIAAIFVHPLFFISGVCIGFSYLLLEK